MWNWGYVGNTVDGNTHRAESADCAVAAKTNAFDVDVNTVHAVIALSDFCNFFCGDLGCVSSALLGTAETVSTSGGSSTVISGGTDTTTITGGSTNTNIVYRDEEIDVVQPARVWWISFACVKLPTSSTSSSISMGGTSPDSVRKT